MKIFIILNLYLNIYAALLYESYILLNNTFIFDFFFEFGLADSEW
jgi:hypothetical protein